MTLLMPTDSCTDDRTIDLGAAIVGIHTPWWPHPRVFISVLNIFLRFDAPAAGTYWPDLPCYPREKRVIDPRNWQTLDDRGERGGTRPLQANDPRCVEQRVDRGGIARLPPDPADRALQADVLVFRRLGGLLVGRLHGVQ